MVFDLKMLIFPNNKNDEEENVDYILNYKFTVVEVISLKNVITYL